MSRRFVFQLSLSITAWLSPTLLLAQRAAPAAAGHFSAAASGHLGSISGQPTSHAPVHSSQVSHPSASGRPATRSTHAVATHSTARPSAYKAPVHGDPAHPRPNSMYGNPYSSNDYPAPGLGFDYVHYAAVHPNSGPNRDHFRGGTIFPVFGGGYYYPGTDYVDSGTTDTQSSDVNQDGSDIQPVPSAEADAQREEAPISSLRSRPTPVPPSSEYIFVRRDGSVFFAVAYSWVNGELQYVTKDGLRKLVSAGTLDLDATTQFNEQRGVAFHSPA